MQQLTPRLIQAQIDNDMRADSEKAGQFLAARTLLRERLGRGELSQEEVADADHKAEQQVQALEKKYSDYNANTGRAFSDMVASAAQKVIEQTHQRNAAAAATATAPTANTNSASSPASAPTPTAKAPEYLKQMPEPDRVIADIRGSDQLDTAARQSAAFERLIDVVIVLSGNANTPGGPRLTTEERDLNGRYTRAATTLENAAYRSLDPGDKQRLDENSKRNQWNRQRIGYGSNTVFVSALLQRYLTPDLSKKYLAAFSAMQAVNQAATAQQNRNRQAVEQQAASQALAARERESISDAINTIVQWVGILGAAALTIFAIMWFRGAKARREARLQQKWRADNQERMSKYGGRKDEISKNIDITFNEKRKTVGFRFNEREIKCEFTRALSAMSPRERESLRAAYHLYNCGLLDDNDFRLTRLALVYGDGKATILGDYKYTYQNCSSIGEAIKQAQGSTNLEGIISFTLARLQDAVKQKPDDPLLQRLSSRLLGDGGDLAPGAPLKSGVKGETPERGLVLGLDEKRPNTWWYYDGEGSLFTVAPQGSGKTQCQVLPNLLMWKGAAVVLDVKGEIYEQTSRWRQKNVGPVYKFSPLEPAASHRYNPLTFVRADPDFLWEDSRFLADMMIVPGEMTKEPFWEQRARDVLHAAIAVACDEVDVTKRSMSSVLDVLHGVGWNEFISYLKNRGSMRPMVRAGASLSDMDVKMRDSVRQTALAKMSAWDSDRVARATEASDWNPLDLRGGANPTIYMCLPPGEIDSYISVLRVFIAQHIRALISSKVPAHNVHPILFMLDELPRLGPMPPVEEALETGRQYGIKLWMFAQSLGQLKDAYSNADGMIGSCAVRMFMNPSLHDGTAQKISDDIGFQESVIDGTRVKVVEPNVVAGPEFKDAVIVMAASAKAARLGKYFAYQDENLRTRMGEQPEVAR